jgi:nitrite reductase/ring-hydroxylating ferredoxin subunit
MPGATAGKPRADGFRAVGSADLLPPRGRLATVMLDGAEVVIANVRGRYYAIDGLCRHAGAPLGGGRLIGCELTCALHGWTYDVTDGWMTNPALGQRTASYRVRVREGLIELALNAE